MQYGYFDDHAAEYVITRPDTPQSWSNYLGSTRYGAIITNNAGGYSFYQSAARGRFLRMRFNNLPLDQPGRYFYIRDQESGDYWSSSWQPVGKPLDACAYTCRHGLGYSIFEAQVSEIVSRAVYFVPTDQAFEYWRLEVSNPSSRPRRLSIFTFCEFANQWSTEQDLVNLQYSLFIVRAALTEDGLLRIASHDHLSTGEEGLQRHEQSMQTWMGLVGAPLAGYDTSREAFIGPYRAYHNPLAVERGSCSNSQAYGDNACGSLHVDLTLQAGETREILVLLGVGDARTTGRQVMAEFGSLERAAREMEKLQATWKSRLECLQVETPDEALNHTLNVWGLYNSLVAFNWSRSASLVYNGERDGLGFRDSVQDVLGVVSALPGEARRRLELMLTGQVANGGAIPVIRPFDHHPGLEHAPDPAEFRSDDCLWFFNAVPAYVNESGDIGFYEHILPYADQGEGSVYDHLKRALCFNLERLGRHGLPCGLSADWNDCLRLGYHGESLFVAFQLYLGLAEFSRIARALDRPEDGSWARAHQDKLAQAIQEHGWDGDRFIWAIGEDGTVYGSHQVDEGQFYLNTQAWAVISGAATAAQAEQCMQTVHDQLATPNGLMLCAPPFVKTSIEVMRAVVYNPGIKENAGIFNHTQPWGFMAECMLGHGDRAYEYLSAAMPAAYNDHAEIRQSEPYVQAQVTYSPLSPRAGNSRTPWLTGAASWFYFAASQFVLGLKPELDGFRIDPCIPAAWDGFKAVRKFRGRKLVIHLHNPGHIHQGVSRLVVNGQELESSLVPLEKMTPETVVEAWLGTRREKLASSLARKGEPG